MKSILNISAIFFFFNLTIFAQKPSLDSFSINYKGQNLFLTQDIGYEYWGTYTHDDEDVTFTWKIVLVGGGGYFWKKTRVLSGEVAYYKWIESDQKPIIWGVEVEQGEIKMTTVKDYGRNGARELAAIKIFIKVGDEFRTMYLYEKQGQIFLHNGNKEVYLEYDNPPVSSR